MRILIYHIVSATLKEYCARARTHTLSHILKDYLKKICYEAFPFHCGSLG